MMSSFSCHHWTKMRQRDELMKMSMMMAVERWTMMMIMATSLTQGGGDATLGCCSPSSAPHLFMVCGVCMYVCSTLYRLDIYISTVHEILVLMKISRLERVSMAVIPSAMPFIRSLIA
jgi:hypothetical protein